VWQGYLILPKGEQRNGSLTATTSLAKMLRKQGLILMNSIIQEAATELAGWDEQVEGE
jgi:hypothetical protein